MSYNIPKEELWSFIIETTIKCIAIIIIIFSMMTTLFTIQFENTYCKIERNYTIYNEQFEYKTLQEIRNTENGFYKTIYGLGMIREQKEISYKKIECKTKYLKEPLTRSGDIKKQIFEE